VKGAEIAPVDIKAKTTILSDRRHMREKIMEKRMNCIQLSLSSNFFYEPRSASKNRRKMAAKCFETTKIASEQPVQRFRNITKDSKEYILLWLDQNVVSTREYLDVQKKVRQIIPDLKIVDDLDACVNYMTDLKDQKVVLILCSSYNHRFISTIHPLSNLLAVYIYCLENEAAEKWGKDYGILKIRGVFTQTKDLVMSISTDQEVRGISSIKLSDKQQVRVK
jgi:hypothetical protein